ncbi:MAG TPA: bifunctional UDP-N-acetylglucosamine diphosphorylase/glucosamine-1-phosphate N-acetyltransferase GlmU, partial [Legionellaceae bacterium]|nr:bifunctional UDP-N-acetylglucosamine diphosphorylase/glucosamine-1-phosphate N-acetyltransferase GlmU [Legionellaceae bacterium]
IAIIEEKDTTDEQRLITEIYSGICCTSADNLHRWLRSITPKNAQKEYYFTDIIAMACAEYKEVLGMHAEDYQEILGVNDRLQLQQVERIWQQRIAEALLLSGVSLADAKRFDVRGELKCGRDVFIDINNLFKGHVSIGEGSHIEPNCVLNNVTIGTNCRIHASSVLEDCVIGDHCDIGPFARIRPGTQLATHCKIGNFVETKKAVFGAHSKANHLSYLGDVTIGAEVNIGAGTITCNYDGANKHHTIIEDGVHIGSDTQLVAPITVGKNATIGAGTTLRNNAPPDALTLTISEQKTIQGWQRPENKEK